MKNSPSRAQVFSLSATIPKSKKRKEYFIFLTALFLFVFLFLKGDLQGHGHSSEHFQNLTEFSKWEPDKKDPYVFKALNVSEENSAKITSPVFTPVASFLIILLFIALCFLMVSVFRKSRFVKELLQELENQKRENKFLADKLSGLQNRLQSFFNLIPLALFVLDEDGIIRQSNARARHDFGPGLEGKRIRDLIVPGDAERLEQAFDCALGGFKSSITTQMIGPERNMHCRIMLVPHGGDALPGVLCVVFDESERLDLENRIRERTRMLERVIDGIPVATTMVDDTGNVIIWNRAAELMTGILREEVIGKELDLRPLFGGRELPVPALLLLKYSPEEIGSRFRGRIRQHGQLPDAVEARGMIFAGREERYVHIVAAKVYDDVGKLIGVVQCAKDVTDELKLRENVFQIQKMEAIGRLVSGIAHDLNNVLTVILGGCDLLAICLDDKENAERYLQEIREAVRRAGKLVERLLGYSKRQRFLPRSIDINESVKNAVNSIADVLGEDITLELNLYHQPIICRIDPFHLEQSVVNLLVNAREAVSTGGKITVETALEKVNREIRVHHFSVPPGVYARVSISDNGCGIDRDILRHIFEPYFTTKKGGSGLGLAMVYGFVNQSGGYITVDSSVGEGTTFTIYLPVISNNEGENDAGSTDRARVKNILLVEDDPAIRNLLQPSLSVAGYVVKVAASFEEALKIFQEDPRFFDLLLVDVVLPDRSGWELAESLLRMNPQLKVLYMTGYNGQYLEKLGLNEEKLKQIIQKPFAVEELLKRIKEIWCLPL